MYGAIKISFKKILSDVGKVLFKYIIPATIVLNFELVQDPFELVLVLYISHSNSIFKYVGLYALKDR